jgi:NAD(P)-dependent dehydrogenase (short-subunit alcohol dehydrogenase family)
MNQARTVLIVGGSGGIGRACALELTVAGFSVILAARDPDRLAAAARDVGASRWIAADSADERGAAAIADAVTEVHVVIHLAGVNPGRGPLREVSAETFDSVIRSNLRSAFLLSKAIVPKMVRGGRMIFVSSTSAARGLPGFGAYSASKGGLRALVGALAGEISADGINVSVLTPGPVDTSMFDTGPPGVPLLRPRDVAQAARYLAELHPSVTLEELILRANSQHAVTVSQSAALANHRAD